MRWIVLMALLAGCASVRVEEENRELKARVAQLERELKQARFWRGVYDRKYGDIGHGGPEGRVFEVRGRFVGLSVGSDDGVRVGDVFNVRRDADYVGQVTVTKAMKGQSVAEFDDEYPGDAAPPQAGDVAYPAR